MAPIVSGTVALEPIGFVVSPFKEKFGTPRQPGLASSTEGRIRLRSDLNSDALDGLAEYSHAWILFYFHENYRDGSGQRSIKTKVHPPRLAGRAVGVFATRSPHRPNPIGLSLVQILRIDGRDLVISGLDMIDGTPVLDIKPYLPSIEAPPSAHEGWSALAPSRTIQVEWTSTARAAISSTVLESGRQAIDDILSLDPRPVAYRGTPDNPNPYTNRYGFRYLNWNVVYEMPNHNQAVVVGIEHFVDAAPHGDVTP